MPPNRSIMIKLIAEKNKAQEEEVAPLVEKKEEPQQAKKEVVIEPEVNEVIESNTLDSSLQEENVDQSLSKKKPLPVKSKMT